MILDRGELAECQLLDFGKHFELIGGAERERGAGRPRPCSPSDAVNIASGIVWHLVVDHVRNTFHIDAAGDNVGPDQHLNPAPVECRKRALAGALGLVRVDSVRGNTAVFELPCEAVRLVLGPGEHKRSQNVRAAQDIGEQFALVRLFDKHHFLLDFAGDRCRGGDFHLYRVIQHVRGELGDFPGQGRPKEQGLALPGKFGYDFADIGDETHVQHAVGLVENQDFDVVEPDTSLAEEIEQASRCRDKDIRIFSERFDLRCLRHPAEYHGGVQGEIPPVRPQALVDLEREFAGRGQDQRADALVVRFPFIEQVQHRERKRRGLASAGLRGREQVTAGEHLRNGFFLNGGRRLIAFLLDCAENGFVE